MEQISKVVIRIICFLGLGLIVKCNPEKGDLNFSEIDLAAMSYFVEVDISHIGPGLIDYKYSNRTVYYKKQNDTNGYYIAGFNEGNSENLYVADKFGNPINSGSINLSAGEKKIVYELISKCLSSSILGIRKRKGVVEITLSYSDSSYFDMLKVDSNYKDFEIETLLEAGYKDQVDYTYRYQVLNFDNASKEQLDWYIKRFTMKKFKNNWYFKRTSRAYHFESII